MLDAKNRHLSEAACSRDSQDRACDELLQQLKSFHGPDYINELMRYLVKIFEVEPEEQEQEQEQERDADEGDFELVPTAPTAPPLSIYILPQTYEERR